MRVLSLALTLIANSVARSGRLVSKVTDPSAPVALTCAQFHPDGLIFGTGGSILIFLLNYLTLDLLRNC